MRNTMSAIVTAIVLAVGTTSAQGATISTGFNLNSASGWETSAENLLQNIVDSGFDFDGTVNSPSEIVIDDFLGPNALFSAVLVEREQGEVDPISLDGLIVRYFSDDSGNTFNVNQTIYTGVDYDGTLVRGWIGGSEVASGTDGSTNVDRILLYGIGVNFDDAPANRSYFENELDFNVTVQYDLLPLSQGFVTTMVTGTVVPTPSALALGVVGTLILISRRQRA